MVGFAYIETRWSPGDSAEAQNQPMDGSAGQLGGQKAHIQTFEIVPQ